MTSLVRKSIVTAFAGAAVVVVGAGPAAAQPNQNQDGLVNVAIGDITILEDVNIGVGAQVAANVCGVKVGPVAVLGRATDRSGTTTTVCETEQGPVTFLQN